MKIKDRVLGIVLADVTEDAVEASINMLISSGYDPIVINDKAKVASWQFRRALNQMGLRADVETAVAASNQDTKDMWEYSQTFDRQHPFVAAIALVLNKTDDEIDAVFALAKSIVI